MMYDTRARSYQIPETLLLLTRNTQESDPLQLLLYIELCYQQNLETQFNITLKPV